MYAPELIIALGTALTMIVFGIHQTVNPRKWLDYIPPTFAALSPLKLETDMRLHAAGNIFFGLLLASGLFPLTAAWIALIWWITILPFAFRHSWAIGMRDLTIVFGLIALVVSLS